MTSDATSSTRQHRLVREYGLIAIEDLNIKGMAGSMLAKSVHDAGWGQFISILSSKAECAGRTFVKVNPAGTTQDCSTCGEHVPKTLSERWHSCACGLSVGTVSATLAQAHASLRATLGAVEVRE